MSSDQDVRGRFTAGNLAALKQGTRSPRIRAEKRRDLTQDIRDMVLTHWPHLARQGPLLDMLVDCLADVRQLRDYVEDHGGPVGGRGRLLKPMEMLRAREHDVLAIADRLVIAPREIAKLGSAAGLSTPGEVEAAAGRRQLIQLYGKKTD